MTHSLGRIVSPPVKLLLVDDDDFVLRSVGRLATRSGFKAENIITASNVPEAIKRFDGERDSIKAAFSDMQMPGPFGIELYRHVRKTHPHIPFAFSSADMPDAIWQEMEYFLNMDPRVVFFPKPTDPPAVVAWFKGALEVLLDP